MNARKKLFVFNSVIIVLLAVVTVVTVWISSRNVFKNQAEVHLVDVVSESAQELFDSHGLVSDNFRFMRDGVYVSIYADDGTLVNGIAPEGASEDVLPPVKRGIFQTFNADGEKYYVYDYKVDIPGRPSLYVRGIGLTNDAQLNSILFTCAVVAVLVCAFAIAVSLLIIKNAVKPIEKMTASVESINQSKDLSLRLEVNKSDKDVYKLEIAYNAMLERLENLFRNQERFTSDVSHELRTPLTVILAEAEFAIEDAKTEEEKSASLSVILRQTKKLVNITNQILEFSRFVNKNAINLEKTDISALTEECSVPANNSKGITIERDIEPKVFAFVEKTMYQRMLQNLIDNALKYGADGGYVKVSLKKSESGAVLSVSDNGIGMSVDTQMHVFERFYQADKSRSSSGSLGLGLSFVKEIVRLFKADVSLSSEEGKGTVFTIKFND